MTRKKKYQEKTVKVGITKLVLYSLDGITWSSNKSELKGIHQRLEEKREVCKTRIVGKKDAPKKQATEPKKASNKAKSKKVAGKKSTAKSKKKSA